MKDQRDEPDLAEAQAELGLEQGINGQDERLDGVVQEMREADRAEYAEGSSGAGSWWWDWDIGRLGGGGSVFHGS